MSGIKLYRGTGRFLIEHTPSLKAVEFERFAPETEDLFEIVRQHFFPSRPRRLASTFWTPSLPTAQRYANLASSLFGKYKDPLSGAFISGVIKNPKEVFFGDPAYWLRAQSLIASSKGEVAFGKVAPFAHGYWKGLSIKGIQEAARNPQNINAIEAVLPGTTRSEKIWKTQHGAMRLIPGYDGAYNTIEGLNEDGLAAWLRKINTEFGSGWDKARALAKILTGSSADLTETEFTKFLSSKMFQKGIQSAKETRWLGQGGMGTAYLMRAEFPGGHSLEFVKKKVGGLGNKRLNRTLFANETGAMRTLQDLNAPTLYGTRGKKTIFMEYIEGTSATDFLMKGGQMTQSQINELQGFLNIAHSRGVAHTDIWRGLGMRQMFKNDISGFSKQIMPDFELTPWNTILTPEGRVGVIDWGLASSVKNIEDVVGAEVLMTRTLHPSATPAQIDDLLVSALKRQSGRTPKYRADFTPPQAKSKSRASPSPITNPEGPRARRRLINSARDLKVAQAHISNAAIAGARRHRSYNTGRGLEQINEVLGFAHTIPEDIGMVMTWPARR